MRRKTRTSENFLLPGGPLSDVFGSVSVAADSRRLSKRMSTYRSRTSLSLSVAITSLVSFSLRGFPASGPRLTFDDVSPMRLLDLVARLLFDDCPAARATLPAFDPGITPAETFFLQSRRLCTGLSHRKQWTRFEVASSASKTTVVD